jgi:hypothetical protein
MSCRVQLFPPSNDTPSNSPLTTSGSVAVVTMFDGSAGLTAIASSASLPCATLESKFCGIGETAAPAGADTDASSPKTTKAGIEAVKIRPNRRLTLASLQWHRARQKPSYDEIPAIVSGRTHFLELPDVRYQARRPLSHPASSSGSETEDRS